MTTADLQCWRCGAGLRGVPLPVGRGEQCSSCFSSQRACRGCAFFDPDAHNACREPMADGVRDKEAANSCDYFRPRTGEQTEAGAGEAEAARAKLEAAFGGGGPPPLRGGSLAEEAAALKAKGGDEAETARDKLEHLFGKKEE